MRTLDMQQTRGIKNTQAYDTLVSIYTQGSYKVHPRLNSTYYCPSLLPLTLQLLWPTYPPLPSPRPMVHFYSDFKKLKIALLLCAISLFSSCGIVLQQSYVTTATWNQQQT